MDLLDPIDSLMITAELISSPMHVAALLILRPPDGVDTDAYLRALYEDSLTARVEIDPRLRRVPHRGLDTGFLWVWRDVEDDGGHLDIRHHCQRRTLPPGGGPDALWQLVSELHAVPMNRAEPQWMAYLIDGLPDGRFAFYIKVHHIVVDGVAGLQMITRSLSTDAGERGMPPFYAAASPPKATGTAEQPRHGAGLIPALREIASAVGSPESRGVVTPFSAPQTRFNAKLGSHRAVAGAGLKRSRVRAVQQAAAVTGNDVMMTVISSVLRDWLDERDELPDKSLVAICPVTVRDHGPAAADSHGNRFGLGLCTLRTDIDDPARRLAAVSAAMAALKKEVSEHGPGAMLIAMGPAIGPTILLPLLPFATGVPPSFNIPISNVPGPREQMYFNGSSVDEMYPVSTVYDGMALNVTVCSYAETISVGYVADHDVMPDIQTLIPLTEKAMSDLERAVGLGQPRLTSRP